MTTNYSLDWIDHKNLNYKNMEHASDRILRQCLLLEEYGVELMVIQGKTNKTTDILNRNEFIHKPNIQFNTTKFGAMIHGMHVNEISMPIDYLLIYTYQ